jgi:hypothetical protein
MLTYVVHVLLVARFLAEKTLLAEQAGALIYIGILIY